MSLFQNHGRAPVPAGRPQQGGIDPRRKLQELQAHPSSTLAEAGFTVPEDLTGPQEILDYLLESGQVKQNAFSRALQMLGGGRPGPRR